MSTEMRRCRGFTILTVVAIASVVAAAGAWTASAPRLSGIRL
jgi:hypothetical protein